jgi:phosphoenolpyruvate carboxykinase (ATP)
MNEFGHKPKNADLAKVGLGKVGEIYWNLEPAELVEQSIVNGQGVLADSGALAIDTGEFTGRSPKDKFCVKDAKTENTVWWGDVNFPITPENFDRLHDRMAAYLQGREVFVKDSYACADPTFKLNFRVVAEYPERHVRRQYVPAPDQSGTGKSSTPSGTSSAPRLPCRPGHRRHPPA